MVVAIDGPAGVGKSSVAARIAESHGFFNLNSGAFYRAMALKARGVESTDEAAVLRALSNTRLQLIDGCLHLDGRNVESLLRSDEIDHASSIISAFVEVRSLVNASLRQAAQGMDLVVEGRDMTSVVFPDAEVKVYLDAHPAIRARRRFEQGVSEKTPLELETAIRERDRRDREKTQGALIIAPGVAIIDTSTLTLAQVCEKVDRLIEKYSRISCPGENMPESDTFAQESNQDQLQERFLEALDQIEEGDLIKGAVIQVDEEFVYLDVGLKSDGKIPVGEFTDIPPVGEIVEAILVKRENRDGEVVISKRRADEKIFWKTLRAAFDASEPVEGTVKKTIKGGFEVDLGCGMTAFCPISKMDTQRIEQPEEYLGLRSPFLIDRLYSDKKVDIVLTRRLWLEKQTEKNRAVFFENASIGDEVEGTVKSFTSFGAFIDLGGFDGLLHINDMSWGHVTRPKEYVKKGEKIKLKVIRLDREAMKINLSVKHFQPDPWSTFEQKYHVDQVIKGRVTKLTDFGAFIELEEGIEGLAHISELSWVKRVKHPKELFAIGDECEAMILGYDIPQGRISLGLKQVLPNPWDEIEEKFPVGTRGSWNVKKITNAGAFVEIEEGIEAFLHVDDLSWTKKTRNASTVLTEGEPVEATIISLNPAERRIRLSVKHLQGDPWQDFAQKHPRGSIIEGEISGKTDFGVFVKVEGDIEGLIHKNNLTENRDEDAMEKLASLNVGDTIKASVLDVKIDKQKLSFSVREMKYREERAEISKYMDNEKESGASYTLADMLKDKDD